MGKERREEFFWIDSGSQPPAFTGTLKERREFSIANLKGILEVAIELHTRVIGGQIAV